MSAFEIELDDDQAIKSFTLSKFFKKIVKAYRSSKVEFYATPLGGSYTDFGENLGAIYLDEKFSRNPSKRDMKTKNINKLFKRIINGDNYIEFDSLEGAPGKVAISTLKGDDIIECEFSVSKKTKKVTVDAGKGDDIIGCFIDTDDDEDRPKKMPKVILKGGKGRDTFYGVPQGLTAKVKDFNVKKDYIGFDGFTRKYVLRKTSRGVAVIDREKPNGMLLLEGVSSIKKINIVDDQMV